MQSDSSTTWDTAVPTTGDDFTNFLEFNDLDIEFPAFDGEAQVAPAQQHDVSTQNGMKQAYEDSMPAVDYYGQLHHAPGSTRDLRDRMTGLQVRPSSHPMQHGYQQPLYHQPSRIPPTPSSAEIHGHHLRANVVDVQQVAMYEAQMRKQQEQMAFTPLGTPAVTPMDTQIQMREFAVPGEYFSPLASPALHAQNYQSEGSTYYPFQMSDVSEATSPVDATFDPSLKLSAANRRQKRKSPANAPKPSPRAVRQSPAMKAQRKKRSSTIIPAKEIQDVLSGSRPGTANGSQSLGLPPSSISSESPEPLLDMMPPPAIPSARQSPYIPAGSQSAPVRGNAPATPTSLLKMQTQPMSDISLGESALADEDAVMADAPTPTLAALEKKPLVSASAISPSGTAGTPKSRGKTAEFKPPSKGKNRNSSSHPSPALRPKISPSIKPLLPGGMLNADTSALLLASKSNYQNILDGTHLPGVVYPEALSENLTSKRTSHKIAEQGRRNRINTALQEIAALLPQSASGMGDAASATQSSKANTVEQAIDFIKSLQADLKETKEKLAVSESKLQDMSSFQGSVSSIAATPSDPGVDGEKNSQSGDAST